MSLQYWKTWLEQNATSLKLVAHQHNLAKMLNLAWQWCKKITHQITWYINSDIAGLLSLYPPLFTFARPPWSLFLRLFLETLKITWKKNKKHKKTRMRMREWENEVVSARPQSLSALKWKILPFDGEHFWMEMFECKLKPLQRPTLACVISESTHGTK